VGARDLCCEDRRALTLTTLHRSKGRDHVVLINCHSDKLPLLGPRGRRAGAGDPHGAAAGSGQIAADDLPSAHEGACSAQVVAHVDEDALDGIAAQAAASDCPSGNVEEERRLLYMGMTRARRSLALVRPAATAGGRALEASPFLAELPRGLCKDITDAVVPPALHAHVMAVLQTTVQGSASVCAKQRAGTRGVAPQAKRQKRPALQQVPADRALRADVTASTLHAQAGPASTCNVQHKRIGAAGGVPLERSAAPALPAARLPVAAPGARAHDVCAPASSPRALQATPDAAQAFLQPRHHHFVQALALPPEGRSVFMRQLLRFAQLPMFRESARLLQARMAEDLRLWCDFVMALLWRACVYVPATSQESDQTRRCCLGPRRQGCILHSLHTEMQAVP
jgi:ATP-dependent exoDNAse (exonuclease V) beta subunit